MQHEALVAHVDGLLAQKDDRKLRSFVARLTAQDLAYTINHLENGKRKTFAMLPPEVQAEVVLGLTDLSKTFVLPRISDHIIARFLHFNEEDDAADILQFLEPERRGAILSLIKPEKRAKVEKLLTFHPETAGGLMDLNFITVDADVTLRDVVQHVRDHSQARKPTPMVVVLGKDAKVKGYIPYKSLMVSPPTRTVDDALQPLITVLHSADQETIVRMAMRERGELFGVVDDQGHFLGIVHLRDLLRVAQMEATEDVYRFAGVSPEEEMLGTAGEAVRMRYKWLMVNLGTAFLAASVVALFEGTIAKLAMLATFMPIVAGMGGNAGTQTLAVAVRGLAISDINHGQKIRLIIKEAIAGLVNGILTGSVAAGIIYVLRGDPKIGLILGASMVINLVVAGIAGATIPLTLRAMRIDPAVASAVFVTTATDIFGFFTFLGLASVFLV